MSLLALAAHIGTPCPERNERANRALEDLGYPRWTPPTVTPKAVEPWVIPVNQENEE